MSFNSTDKRVKEHIYAGKCKGEVIYRLINPETKKESEGERMTAVK